LAAASGYRAGVSPTLSLNQERGLTVRGFVAGAMKKAGCMVESFKPEGGERTYRINGITLLHWPAPHCRGGLSCFCATVGPS
jgi:hypothetical protein